jgi:hypothetical protein
MAILTSGNLALEIRIVRRDEEDWIQYEILFTYKGKPIFDDSVLKYRDFSAFWKDRPQGGIKGEECGDDVLTGRIEEALETDEPRYYEAIEPGFLVAVYPNQFFPFMPSNYKLVFQSEESTQREEDIELIRDLVGDKLPNDLFTVIVKLDSFNFQNEIAYSSDGPALILTVTRQELRQFARVLRKEYKALDKPV